MLKKVFLAVPKGIAGNSFKNEKMIRELRKIVDGVVVVGGKVGKSTKEILELAKRLKKVELISDFTSLNFSKLKNFKTIGIIADASVPEIVVQEVVASIWSMFPKVKINYVALG